MWPFKECTTHQPTSTSAAEQKINTKPNSSKARNNHPDYLRTMAIVEFIDQTIFSILSFI
jgi:hypothetical protein